MRTRRRPRRVPLHTRLALAGIALGIVLAVAPWPEPWVERAFARGLFPLVSKLLAPTVGAVPWSVGGVLLALWVGVVVVALLLRDGRRWLRRALLPWTAALVLVGFSLVWGLAYRRAPLDALLGVPGTPPSAEQVATAQQRLLSVVEATAGTAIPTAADVAAASRCVAVEVHRLTGARVAVPRRVVLLPAGSLLRFGFAGVTLPWLLEPHVDAGLPPVVRLASSVHELTHAAGFAREADTDALSVLAGLRCSDPSVRYEVAVHALGLLLAALPEPDRSQLATALPPRVVQDLRAAGAASARYRVSWLERPATALYGGYLRSRGVRAGMADYGRALTLIVQALAHGVA